MMNKIVFVWVSVFLFASCGQLKHDDKGIAVASNGASADADKIDGIVCDSAIIATRPGGVLLTGISEHRLTSVYKVNYDKNGESGFIGSNDFHINESAISSTNGNQWHSHFMPGIEALFGYNLVNVSHYNCKTQKQKMFFDSLVLIHTVYYPSFGVDTLNNKPVARNYYMISVYDEDTNKDGYITASDLRRFYLFDKDLDTKKVLVPKEYSVVQSEYDSANDYMYVFAQFDKNKNGAHEDGEAVHVFWIDLNNPQQTGLMY